MSKHELQLKETKIKEAGKTKRKDIESWIWSQRIILTIIIVAGLVISIGFITGFGGR